MKQSERRKTNPHSGSNYERGHEGISSGDGYKRPALVNAKRESERDRTKIFQKIERSRTKRERTNAPSLQEEPKLVNLTGH